MDSKLYRDFAQVTVQTIKNSVSEYFRPLREYPKTIIGVSLVLGIATYYCDYHHGKSLNQEHENSPSKIELILKK